MSTVNIKITESLSGVEFPYGRLSRENHQFIKEHVGEIFPAKLHNMNYYVLENGMFVHVYNTFEIKETTSVEEDLGTPPLHCQYFLTAGVDGKAIMKGERLYSNYHHQFFEAKGVYVDCDGDVYIYFDGGNVKLTSIVREEAAMKFLNPVIPNQSEVENEAH